MTGGDQGADGAKVDGAAQGVGILLAAAEQVGVPVGPVVELDCGEVQAADIVCDSSDVRG